MLRNILSKSSQNANVRSLVSISNNSFIGSKNRIIAPNRFPSNLVLKNDNLKAGQRRLFSSASPITTAISAKAENGAIVVQSNDSLPMSSAGQEDTLSTTSGIENALNGAAETVLADPAVVQLGYSPTDILVRVFLELHETVGLPWWGSIVVATLLLRTAITPLHITMKRNAAKMAIAAPHIQAFQAKYQISPPRTEAEKLDMTRKWMELQAKYDFKFSRSFLPVLVQLPLFITFFFAAQKITKLYPSMQTGGVLWFTDLTAPDTYYILPLITAGMMFATVELTPEPPPMKSQGPMTPQMHKNMMRGISLITFPATMTFSTAVVVYWATNNTFTLAQNLVLMNPAVMKYLGIPPAPIVQPSTPGSSPAPKPFFQQIEEFTKQQQKQTAANATAPSQVKLQDQFQHEMREARSRRSKKRT